MHQPTFQEAKLAWKHMQKHFPANQTNITVLINIKTPQALNAFAKNLQIVAEYLYVNKNTAYAAVNTAWQVFEGPIIFLEISDYKGDSYNEQVNTFLFSGNFSLPSTLTVFNSK